MTGNRMTEATIDASLDAFLHGARDGDFQQARQLHEMLDRMLTETEIPDGQLWLTKHGKELLAQMHRQLSHCEGEGEQLHESVLDAVQLRTRPDYWPDTCSYVHDLKVAITVANELCEQRNAGKKPSVNEAAKAVADRGEFGLGLSEILEVYDHIAATVGGFSEFSRC